MLCEWLCNLSNCCCASDQMVNPPSLCCSMFAFTILTFGILRDPKFWILVFLHNILHLGIGRLMRITSFVIVQLWKEYFISSLASLFVLNSDRVVKPLHGLRRTLSNRVLR